MSAKEIDLIAAAEADLKKIPRERRLSGLNKISELTIPAYLAYIRAKGLVDDLGEISPDILNNLPRNPYKQTRFVEIESAEINICLRQKWSDLKGPIEIVGEKDRRLFKLFEIAEEHTFEYTDQRGNKELVKDIKRFGNLNNLFSLYKLSANGPLH